MAFPSCFILYMFMSFFVMDCMARELPPLPALPIPTARHLKWQRRERAMFLHFGMNTFTDSEWGTGKDDPSTFAPSNLDTRQWMQVAKRSGFQLVILTVKHHDGFCLWPSAYTNYSVSSSKWKNGKGDVVREFVDAAAEVGIEVGIYLSPWDRHEPSYGDTIGYNQFYLAQLRELLTQYGRISEVWLDGAKAVNATNMQYMFNEWFQLIRQLQPDAVIFSDAGPDVRWVGDEQGFAGETCWSMINTELVQIGNASSEYLQHGDMYGREWVPAECDVSVRPGWFWHKNEKPMELTTLIDLYFRSVGRNCVLLLNVPPNATGLISKEDATTLIEFNALLSSYSEDLAAAAEVRRINSTTMEWDMGKPTIFSVISLQEEIEYGQRVSCYNVQIYEDKEWKIIAEGKTIGYKRMHRLGKVIEASLVKIVIIETRSSPAFVLLKLHRDFVHVDTKKNNTEN